MSGTEPARADEIVVPDSLQLAAGESLSVNLAAGLRDFFVSGTTDGPGYYVTDDVAMQLNSGVSTVGIVASADASDALAGDAQSALGGRGTVVTGGDRAVVEPEHVTHRRNLGDQLLVAMSALALFTTAFVVASTLALATSERRRDIALLRTVGASPGQVRRMVLGEAAVIGLVGGLAGAAVGVAAAPVMGALLAGLDVLPANFIVHVSMWPLIVAMGVGVAVAVVGAWAAARSATRIAPIDALVSAAVEQRPMSRMRWAIGLSALLGGTAASVMTVTAGADNRINSAFVAAMMLIAAAALLAPVVIGPIAACITWPFLRRSRWAPPVLIRAELTTGTRRAGGTLAPVIAAVGFAVLLSGMVTTMAAAYPAERTEQLRGLALVTPDGAAGLSDDVVAATGAGPVGSRAPLPTRVFVRDADGSTMVIDGIGSLDERYAAPGEAVLDENSAELLGVRVGDTIPVRFLDGTSEDVAVAQVLPLDPARGPFVLPREQVRAHDPSALTDSVFVPENRAPTSLPAGAVVVDAYTYALHDYMVDARLTNWLATVLTVMTVGYSGLAVANSMAMSAHRRRPDIAALKGAGGTARQLMSTAVGETAILVLIGSALGVLVTVPPLWAMAAGLSEATGIDVSLHVAWPTVLGVAAGCLVLALASTAIVTRRVTKGVRG